MEQKFKRVKRVAHLYERSYQTAAGEWRTKFYGIFKCMWKGERKRKVFSLGGDLRTAKEALALLLAENVKGKDFGAEPEPQKQGITFSEWADDYFKNKIDPEKHAGGVEREKRSFKTLAPYFGGMLLSGIKRSTIMEYAAKRITQPIMRRGKPVEFDDGSGKCDDAGNPVKVEKKIQFPTVNRKLAFLRYLLNLAADDGIIEAAPSVKLKSEKSRKRERVASEGEYRSLLASMSRPAQRVLIALYETAMRANEVLRLPWNMVDEKAGFIRLPADYVKEKKNRTVPISPELRAVLYELRAEQRKVSSISSGVSSRVFTRNSRPMTSVRTAFELAKEKAGVTDLHLLHDLRHTAITRWATQGIAQQAIMAAAGHHSIQQSNAYVNMKDEHLRDAFKVSTQVIQGNAVDAAQAVSY